MCCSPLSQQKIWMRTMSSGSSLSHSGRKRPRPESSTQSECPALFALLWRTILQLDQVLQAQILSYCDEGQLYVLLSSSSKSAAAKEVSSAIACALAIKAGINGSFLLQVLPNSLSSRRGVPHDEAMARFLHILQGNGSTATSSEISIIHADQNLAHSNGAPQGGMPSSMLETLKSVECSHLRSLTGRPWLRKLGRLPNLHTLNLEGCALLDQSALTDFLRLASPSLRCLNLMGCHQVGNQVLEAIRIHHSQLQSLSLGGCSQTISESALVALLSALPQLQHLDCQALNGMKSLSNNLLSLLPSALRSLNVSSCKEFFLQGREAFLTRDQYSPSALMMRVRHGEAASQRGGSEPISRLQLRHVVLDSANSRTSGPGEGVLAYFALGRCLREVHLAGCEAVRDWEVGLLATQCNRTLACLQMRACKITNQSLFALAKRCHSLTELDVSACFQITSEGLSFFCENHRAGSYGSSGDGTMTLANTHNTSPLRVLRVSNLIKLTDEGVESIRHLKALLVLDLGACYQVTAETVCRTILQLPHLIDINARDIAGAQGLARLLRQNATKIPQGLRILNKRFLPTPDIPRGCCTVRRYGQRILKSKHKPATMYHCLDCELIPQLDRGMCAECASKCHHGHRTFVGAWTRFYCDCAFGVAGNICRCIFPDEAKTLTPVSTRNTVRSTA